MIPAGVVAYRGTGMAISAGECALWISQIDKMIYGEYLRKREIFTQYTNNQLENGLEAALIWPASSCEGMIDFSLRSTRVRESVVVNAISSRISLVNK